MFNIEITKNEKNKLKWIEHLKRIPEVDEKKEYDMILRKREKVILNSLKRVKKQDKYTYLNYLNRFVANKDISSEMENMEQEFSELLFTN